MTALGYFPEEIVPVVAPELTAPSERVTATGSKRALTIGERRRRSRKEVARWLKTLPPGQRLPRRDEEMRKVASAAAEAFKAAEAEERRRHAWLSKRGEDAERDPQLLRARIARLEAEADYSRATRANRLGVSVEAEVWWHEQTAFDEIWEQLTSDLVEQTNGQIRDVECASAPAEKMRVFNAGDLSREERQKYGL